MSDLKPIGEIIKADIKGVKQESSPIKNGQSPMLSTTGSTVLCNDTYGCTICQDAHYIYPRHEDGTIDYSQAVPCLCVRNKMARDKKKRLLSWCELPAASENMTFESFKVSPLQKQAHDAALKVVSGELKWLTLTSKPNTGKTHLAVAICRKWLETGKPARYSYVPLLMGELRSGFNDKENDYDRRFEMFLNVPLLVLDDLGTENPTPFVQEKLDTIIDYRLMHDLSLVVTTNLSLSQLPERIASRLRRGGEIVTISGPEHRVQY